MENEIKNNLLSDIEDSCKGIDCKLNATAKCEDIDETKEDVVHVNKRDTFNLEIKRKKQKLTNVQFQLNAKPKSNATLKGDKLRNTLEKNNKYKIKLDKIRLICLRGHVQRKSKCG